MRVVSAELRVRYAETDQMGVVYYANYLVWCEVGRTEFIRVSGRSYAELEAEGVMLAVSEASVRYLTAARYDDVVRIDTRLVELRSRAVVFEYEITNRDTLARIATARTTLVPLNRDGRLIALPPQVRSWLDAAREA